MTRLFGRLAVALACVWLVATPLAAQTPTESETKKEVPALTAMHDVMYPMWHEAWPKKDTAALIELAPDVEKHFSAIKKATLPGILRDKATAWDAGVEKLGLAVSAYAAAAKAKDDATLLKAAETLHSSYEALVKVVRPALKEMDDFHSTLYVLYHYQINPFDRAKATESLKAMKPKMETLTAVVLPDRLKAKQEAFATQRARLSAALDVALGTLATGTEAQIREKIELMHAEYEKLEQIF
jgi:hypothetical protein